MPAEVSVRPNGAAGRTADEGEDEDGGEGADRTAVDRLAPDDYAAGRDRTGRDRNGGYDGVSVVTCADAYAAGPGRTRARVSALARAGMTADPRPDGVLHVQVTPAR